MNKPGPVGKPTEGATARDGVFDLQPVFTAAAEFGGHCFLVDLYLGACDYSARDFQARLLAEFYETGTMVEFDRLLSSQLLLVEVRNQLDRIVGDLGQHRQCGEQPRDCEQDDP